MSRSNDHATVLSALTRSTPGPRSKVVTSRAARLLTSLLISVSPASAAELKCPELGDLRTPSLGVAIDGLLPRGQLLQQPDKLASAATLMREHGFSSNNAINHLIALYCPAVAVEADLSMQEKIALVRDFAAEATKAVFASESVDDIIFDVPLSPDLVEQVKELAGHAGLSVDQWIAAVVADTARQRP